MSIIDYFRVIGVAFLVFMITIFPFLSYFHGVKKALQGTAFSFSMAFVVFVLLKVLLEVVFEL